MTRGRKPSIEPSVSTNLHLPETLRARLDILLFSEVEGRVPKGAYQRFFIARLNEFFDSRALDLSPYFGTLPGEAVIRASAHTIERLESVLKQGVGK